MTIARRKTPAGIEPAHLSAPPRLRQSHIDRPFIPMVEDKPGLLARIFGGRK